MTISRILKMVLAKVPEFAGALVPQKFGDNTQLAEAAWQTGKLPCSFKNNLQKRRCVGNLKKSLETQVFSFFIERKNLQEWFLQFKGESTYPFIVFINLLCSTKSTDNMDVPFNCFGL